MSVKILAKKKDLIKKTEVDMSDLYCEDLKKVELFRQELEEMADVYSRFFLDAEISYNNRS